MWRFAAPTLWTALSPQGKPPGVSPKSTVESTSQPAPRRGRSSPRGRQLGQARRVTWRPAAFDARYVSPSYVTKSRTTTAPQPLGRRRRSASRAAARPSSLSESVSPMSPSLSPSSYFPQTSTNAFPWSSLSFAGARPLRRWSASSFCVMTWATVPPATRAAMARCASVGAAPGNRQYIDASQGGGAAPFVAPGSPLARPLATASVQMPSGPR